VPSLPLRTAAYYDATIDGSSIRDIAWYYPEPKEKAKNIRGYVAFYKVTLVPSSSGPFLAHRETVDRIAAADTYFADSDRTRFRSTLRVSRTN